MSIYNEVREDFGQLKTIILKHPYLRVDSDFVNACLKHFLEEFYADFIICLLDEILPEKLLQKRFKLKKMVKVYGILFYRLQGKGAGV